MLKFYEELNGTQQELYNTLVFGIYKEDFDIKRTIQEVLPDDLLNVFKAVKEDQPKDRPKDKEVIGDLWTILGRIVSGVMFWDELESKLPPILEVAQDKGILKDVISIDTSLVLGKQHEDKERAGITKEGYTLTNFLIESNHKSILDRLEMVKKSCGLESFWKVISEDDREKIKTKLNEDEHKHKDMLDEINRIETTIAAKNQPVQTVTDDDSLSGTGSDVTVVGDSVHTTEKISSTEKNLYLGLQNAIDKKEDIAEILKSATKEDLLSTFAEREEQEENANLLHNILQEAKHRLAFFREVKEKGILQDLLNANLSVMKTRQLVDVDNETKTPNIDTEYKLADFIADSEASNLLVLGEIKEVFGFEDFWKASSEADRNMIEGALKREIGKLEDDQEKSKYENYLKEIKTIESEQKLNTTIILRGMARTLDFGDNRESRKEAAKKGMKFGAIGGAITALAVGLGLYFGTGAALTVLPTIIGIALVAALLVGATICAITYDVLKPKSCVDTVHTIKGLDNLKQEANTETSMVVRS